jgi:hypothetical protein
MRLRQCSDWQAGENGGTHHVWYGQPITDVIDKRFSCRTYVNQPIEVAKKQQMETYISSLDSGPFGSPPCFRLLAASNGNRQALRGLGTYGLIKGNTGFIVGLTEKRDHHLEDFGYLMEQIILFATSINLGTCWVGGGFSRSSFADQVEQRAEETIPAVACVGYASEKRSMVDRIIRLRSAPRVRLPWERLFFNGDCRSSLSPEDAGAFAVPLEMVRLGPSAVNGQPWRIIKDGMSWHFYLQRSRGYRWLSAGLFGVPDLQRIDMGIAMCHFELTAIELGLEGCWTADPPEIKDFEAAGEYTASWLARTSSSRPPI